MEAKLYIDGSSLGNPGPGGIGVICKGELENVIFKLSKSAGIVTNNQAEYMAFIEGLKEAKRYNITNVSVFSDSQLLVYQMNDKYKVKNQGLFPYFQKAKEIVRDFDIIKIELIRREENKEADILANNGSRMGE
ncbi:MAG: ribonuclease HI family protein [Spirochaetes bacterium]|nr:ribonuclease HI family protein [Spirochaetota bacterium]